jgi:hypothetical protein
MVSAIQLSALSGPDGNGVRAIVGLEARRSDEMLRDIAAERLPLNRSFFGSGVTVRRPAPNVNSM